MRQNCIQREELLTMLTGINDQLEALEAKLASSLSDYRKDLIHTQEENILKCENRMSKLENKVDLYPLDRPQKDKTIHKSNLKLELGF